MLFDTANLPSRGLVRSYPNQTRPTLRASLLEKTYYDAQYPVDRALLEEQMNADPFKDPVKPSSKALPEIYLKPAATAA